MEFASSYPPPSMGEAVKKSFPHPTVIVVREPGGDERGQHRREETLTEDSTLYPQREAGCFFPPDPWKEDCLMMPSESPSGSRTGEGHGMLFQALQFGARKIFSQLRGWWGWGWTKRDSAPLTFILSRQGRGDISALVNVGRKLSELAIKRI